MSDPVLGVSELSKRFGALKALNSVSFDVNAGEILGIAGPNGSGKSTLFNSITRVPFSQTSGEVRFKGEVISKLPNDQLMVMLFGDHAA